MSDTKKPIGVDADKIGTAQPEKKPRVSSGAAAKPKSDTAAKKPTAKKTAAKPKTAVAKTTEDKPKAKPAKPKTAVAKTATDKTTTTKPKTTTAKTASAAKPKTTTTKASTSTSKPKTATAAKPKATTTTTKATTAAKPKTTTTKASTSTSKPKTATAAKPKATTTTTKATTAAKPKAAPTKRTASKAKPVEPENVEPVDKSEPVVEEQSAQAAVTQSVDVERQDAEPIDTALQSDTAPVDVEPKSAASEVAATDSVDTAQAEEQRAVDANVEQAQTEQEQASSDAATAQDRAADASEPKIEKGKRKKRMSVPGIVFTSIGAVIVAFLFFVAVTLAVDKFVYHSPVPSFFGYSTLFVTTGSMSGTIEDGDMIIIHREDEYKIGDVITFLPDGDAVPTTHRIIKIEAGKYYTKGDANNAEDTYPIVKDNIIGKWTGAAIPHFGLFFRWLKDEMGWVYIVAIVAVVIVGIVLLRQFPSDKKSGKEK